MNEFGIIECPICGCDDIKVEVKDNFNIECMCYECGHEFTVNVDIKMADE